MSPFILYLLKANALLVFFWLFYRLFLQKETFYTTLRWYFISSIMLSLSLPLLTFTQTIIIEQQLPLYDTNVTSDFLPETALPTAEPSFWERFGWQNAVFYLVVFISLWCLIRSFYRIINLYIHIKHLPNFKGKSFKISSKQSNIYSFYQWIVVPENKLSCPDLEMILAHENVHLNQKHTLDLILIELVSAVFWFNPLLKTLQKDINTNLEFIVDEKMVANFEPISYQKRLITEQSSNSLTYINAFNSKDLKKRIIQLNTQKSKNMKKLKFLITAPVLATFFVLFQVKTEAQIQTIQVQEVLPTDEKEDSFYVLIHNQYDDVYYERLTKMLNEKYNLNIVIDDLKRNKADELVSISIKSTKNNHVYKNIHKTVGNKPFTSFKLYVYKKGSDYFIKIIENNINDETVAETKLSEKENNFLTILDAVNDVNKFKNDRASFDIIASKIPIFVDDILMSKEELQNFNLTTVQSLHLDASNPEKGTILKLSTKPTDEENLRTFSFKTTNFKNIKINGKDATQEELKNHIDAENKKRETSSSKTEQTHTFTISSSSSTEEKNDNKRVTLKGIGVNNNIVYIVNGKEVSGEDFRKINPEDIERIDVLKDKEITEKYGDKAKDGVLIITTKSNKEVSLQTRKDALKARELVAQKRQQLINEQKEQSVERKKEIEKQRQKLLAKKDENHNEIKSRENEWNELKEIFNTMKDSKKELEDEHTKITNISAKMTLKDGTEIKISEDY